VIGFISCQKMSYIGVLDVIANISDKIGRKLNLPSWLCYRAWNAESEGHAAFRNVSHIQYKKSVAQNSTIGDDIVTWITICGLFEIMVTPKPTCDMCVRVMTGESSLVVRLKADIILSYLIYWNTTNGVSKKNQSKLMCLHGLGSDNIWLPVIFEHHVHVYGSLIHWGPIKVCSRASACNS